ncbi:hypothetical protein [Spirosoma oryzicola]|uniref:hypothetical protein n=1 Tax=Spirosoma oryzicola TaxID=2898794 RepID=UPI001E57C7EA|nr:hypothetical protein [Spirosoma oryzicola]UHG93293.1 hypothetical protein LQ777_10410 [Spirosoma oryzicola]
MAKPNLTGADKANLIAYLKSMYSVGQLHLWLIVLQDSKPIPDMSETDRAMRLDAIREILGKPGSVPAATPKPKSRNK